MRHISFIHTEIGEDWIVSFALDTGEGSIQSLTLLRTPKYEFALEKHERGVSIADEARLDGESEMLQAVRITQATITLIGSEHQFVLSLQGIAPQELHAVRKVLKQMNYDGCFQFQA